MVLGASAGAVGIAQLMPQYHPGVDPNDPEASIMYAGQYLEADDDFGFDLKMPSKHITVAMIHV